MSSTEPSIIAVNQFVDDAEISLNNFTVFRADRVQTRRGGGGVAFYIKSSLKPVRLQLGMEAPPPLYRNDLL